MPSTFRIFDHHAKTLAYLESPTTPRSWILNGFGKAEFSVGLQYLTDKFALKEETIMQYGNLVFIEHIPSKDAAGTANGKLPDWTGIILPDRNWPDKILNATAYSAEAILTFRPVPLTKISGTPASMFKEILGYARSVAEDIVILPGVIEDIPETFSDTLATSAYDHIKKLCSNTGMDWDITGQVDGRGNLQLYANLYRSKGAVTRLELTRDNVEGSGPLLTEQGTPYNVIYGYSSASTKESRYFAKGTNQTSVDKYGVLAGNIVFSGITDQTSLANAAQTLADTSPPLMKLHRVALDIGKTFDSLAAGNTVTVKDNTVGFKPGGGFGFSASARILSLDYNDLTMGKAPLNLEII
jgi:hypothetical protein